MAQKVIWNKRALNDFRKIIEYLQSDCGDEIANDYIVRIDKIVNSIAEQPKMGKVEIPARNIRAFVIVKHATLYYKLNPGKIIVIRIFDNRQDSKKKKF